MKNLKIRPGYRTLAMIALFGLAGCKKYEHTNIFLDMAKDGRKKTILIRDVETGVERIFKADEFGIGRRWYQNYDYLQPGDTVRVVGCGIWGDEPYQNHTILSSRDLSLFYNVDTVYNRRLRKQYAKEKEKFQVIKQNMQDSNQK